MTILYITTLLPIKPTPEEVHALMQPFTVLCVNTKSDLAAEIHVAETVTQEQANTKAAQIQAYLLSRIFEIKLTPPSDG